MINGGPDYKRGGVVAGTDQKRTEIQSPEDGAWATEEPIYKKTFHIV